MSKNVNLNEYNKDDMMNTPNYEKKESKIKSFLYNIYKIALGILIIFLLIKGCSISDPSPTMSERDKYYKSQEYRLTGKSYEKYMEENKYINDLINEMKKKECNN